MRILMALGVLVAVLVISPSAGAAYDYPWCSREGFFGKQNCYFNTFEQCMQTISGIGGFCQRNPFYQARRYHEPRSRKLRRQRS